MNRKSTLLLALFISIFATVSRAQVSLPCPPNSDFELGDYSVWQYYVGSCCPGGVISTPLAVGSPPPAANIPCEFALTGLAPGGSVAITGVDPWGGFPVVGAGNYSLRVGSSRTLYWASMAEYFVHVPTSSIANYSLIYKFAVVLEDPAGHSTATQPKFTATAVDSATNLPIACAQYSYTGDQVGVLPDWVGTVSNTNPVPAASCSNYSTGAYDVYYKPWATTSINLAGLGGHTIIMKFAAGDCGQGGHFGYGYVDMTCGTFAIASLGCGDTVATVSAPSGFANYSWYDSTTFGTLYGTTQTVTFPMPSTPTTYAVIMTPYTGFGCPDTLYTHIQPSNLQINKSPDTLICNGQSALLSTGATDIALPLTYAWAPYTGLSCTTCDNITASPPAGTTIYNFTVTDAAGCTKSDNIKITVDSVAATTAITPTSCFAYADGSATVTPTSGLGLYTYNWSTVPTQTTTVATGLAVGTYSVVVTDFKGCFGSATATITQPPPLTMSIAGTSNPTTCGGSDGTIILTGDFTTSTPYTVSYVFNVTGHDTVSFNSDPTTGNVVITGLSQGVYDSITIVTNACPYNILGPIALTDPPPPALPFISSNSPVCIGDALNIQATDVTPGVTYSWTGPNGFTSILQSSTVSPTTFANQGYYVVTATVNNCYSKDSAAVVINPLPQPSATNDTICSGDTIRLHGSSANGADGYLWNGPNGYISNVQNPWIGNAPATDAGVYSVTVTWNGCTAMATATVTVNQTPDAPVVADTNYCQFDFAPTYVSPPLSATGTNLLWYTTSTGGTGMATAPTPSTSIAGISTWYVTQTTSTTPACTSPRAPITVGVYTLPDPKFTISDSAFCQGTYFTFDVTGANTGVDFSGVTWSFGNGDSIQNANPVVHAFDITGPTAVSVNVYYKVCPDVTLSHPITVFPYPALHLGSDTAICPGGEAIVIGDYENAENPHASWMWSTGETSATINIVAPGTYYVKTTINGCGTSDTVNVLNDCYMNIPNVFSPNGDGVNDYFYPRQFLTKGLTSFSMNIYNRWGQLIFTSTSIDGRGWDGSFNGVPQPEGVYVYIIDATFKDGQKQHHQGNITLLR